MEEKSIVIFNPALARNLLKQGYRIIDIKANREDEKRTVFVFKVEDGFMEYVDNYKK